MEQDQQVKVLSVVGARPQFIKLAPVAMALSQAGIKHSIVHTGQHYDTSMTDVFFEDLAIPAPDVFLGVGSGTHATQTAAMLARLEPVLLDHLPDWVLIYGDTNSTLAAALCAVKINLPVAHLEAGLRSFNRRMPEEHNRILADHASDLLLAPTAGAMHRLGIEGLADRAVLVGDVMIDVCLTVVGAQARGKGAAPHLGVTPGEYAVATISPSREHRRSSPFAGLGCCPRASARPRRTPCSSEIARSGIGRRSSPRDRVTLADGGTCLSEDDQLGRWRPRRADRFGGLQNDVTRSGCHAPLCVRRPNGSRPLLAAGTCSSPNPTLSAMSRCGRPQTPSGRPTSGTGMPRHEW